MNRLVFLTILGFATALLASGCMWGIVRDADTGAPVPGAEVRVTDSNGVTRFTTTNSSGRYVFDQANGQAPAAGPLIIEAAGPGYRSKMWEWVVEYNDNPNASLLNLSSFWEVLSFTLQPFAVQPAARIAFTSDRDGNFEIYVMNADGTGQTRLANNPADDRDPAWSPDGSRIALKGGRTGNFEIYVMNRSGERRVGKE